MSENEPVIENQTPKEVGAAEVREAAAEVLEGAEAELELMMMCGTEQLEEAMTDVDIFSQFVMFMAAGLAEGIRTERLEQLLSAAAKEGDNDVAQTLQDNLVDIATVVQDDEVVARIQAILNNR